MGRHGSRSRVGRMKVREPAECWFEWSKLTTRGVRKWARAANLGRKVRCLRGRGASGSERQNAVENGRSMAGRKEHREAGRGKEHWKAAGIHEVRPESCRWLLMTPVFPSMIKLTSIATNKEQNLIVKQTNTTQEELSQRK